MMNLKKSVQEKINNLLFDKILDFTLSVRRFTHIRA